MKKIFWDWISSFNNNTQGMSARKLSAFFACAVGAVLSFKFGSQGTAVELTLIWVSFALLCMGIITVQQIIDFKSGRVSTTTTTETKTETKTEPKPE